MYHRNYAIRLATLLGHISQRLDDNKLETMCSEEAKAWFKRIPHNSVARKPRNISEYSLWRPELDPDNPVRRHYLKPVVQFWVTSDELERWTNDNRRDLTRLLYPCVFEFHVPPVLKITFNRHDLAFLSAISTARAEGRQLIYFSYVSASVRPFVCCVTRHVSSSLRFLRRDFFFNKGITYFEYCHVGHRIKVWFVHISGTMHTVAPRGDIFLRKTYT